MHLLHSHLTLLPQKLPIVEGSGRRKIDKEGVSRSENLSWRQPARTPSNFSLQGLYHFNILL